ncbi:hypothetical protein MTP99_015507 [Tenebrio molitor]|nr:hypothetical protein MTP99_015507 [Tenebrio molitor]
MKLSRGRLPDRRNDAGGQRIDPCKCSVSILPIFAPAPDNLPEKGKRMWCSCSPLIRYSCPVVMNTCPYDLRPWNYKTRRPPAGTRSTPKLI